MKNQSPCPTKEIKIIITQTKEIYKFKTPEDFRKALKWIEKKYGW